MSTRCSAMELWIYLTTPLPNHDLSKTRVCSDPVVLKCHGNFVITKTAWLCSMSCSRMQDQILTFMNLTSADEIQTYYWMADYQSLMKILRIKPCIYLKRMASHNRQEVIDRIGLRLRRRVVGLPIRPPSYYNRRRLWKMSRINMLTKSFVSECIHQFTCTCNSMYMEQRSLECLIDEHVSKNISLTS